ncbi:MAG: MarR family transcriptional regulator [bacterium]
MKRLLEEKQRQDYYGEMGIVLERTGIPRIAGKIFSYLILSAKTEVSTDELMEGLHASRGSISTMTRMLIQMGLVDRVGISGERKDYFRIRPGTMTNVIKAKMATIIEFHTVIEHGLSLVQQKNTVAYTRLKEMHEFYSFIEREFPSLFERWEEYQKTLK